MSLAAALATLGTDYLRVKTQGSDTAAGVVLETLDALCATLCESAEEEDIQLLNAVSKAISHICFSCDEESDGSSGSGEYKFCGAVLTHAFLFLKEHVLEHIADRRIRAAYAQLLSTMIMRSGILFDLLDRDVQSPGDFLSAFRSLPLDIEPWCTSLLADLVSIHGSDAVAVSVDVACALLLAGNAFVTQFFTLHLRDVLTSLQQATAMEHREKLLTLISIILSSTSRGPAVQNGDVLVPDFCMAISKETAVTGTVLADALKPCVIIPSGDVRSLVADIVGLLLEPTIGSFYSKCSSSLFSAASGFTDYLIEAIRHPLRHKEVLQEASHVTPSVTASSLATPIIRTLAHIAVHFPEELSAKWSYALPVICQASSTGYDDEATTATFNLFANSCSVWHEVSHDVANDIGQMFLQSGARLSSAVDGNNLNIESARNCFEAGILMLTELTARRRLPTSSAMELLECAECMGILLPYNPSAPIFVRNVLSLISDETLSTAPVDVCQRVRTVAIDVWGQHIIHLFSANEACPISLASGLRLLGAALDVRFFGSCAEREIQDVALHFWREIPPATVYKKLSVSVLGAGNIENFQRDAIGSSELWASTYKQESDSAEIALVESGESARHDCHEADATVRGYFARILVALSNVLQEHGSTTCLTYRMLERSMPTSVSGVLCHLSSSTSPEELRTALTLVLACLLQSSTSIAAPASILRALVERTESDSILSDRFQECVLPVIRLKFLCCEGNQSLTREILIPKELCSLAFSADQLNIVGADSNFFFHVLSCHDTELRVGAWKTMAESRVRGDADWNVIDVRLAELLGTSPSTAKCFITSCLEGTQGIRHLALDLMSLRPESVATALLKVGLSSVVICGIEQRQVLVNCSDSSPSSLATIETSDVCLADLIMIVTMAVQYADRESLHRMLMMLVDIYVSTSNHSAGSRSSFLDTAILRCIISALNVPPKDRYASKVSTREPILEYMEQTKATSTMQKKLREAVSKISGLGTPLTVTTVGWREDDEFELAAGACALNYVIRHQIELSGGGNVDSSQLEQLWISSLSSESEWLVLLFHSRLDIGQHASSCRRAACMQLLTTLVVQSLLFRKEFMQKMIREVVGPQVLTNAVAAAASPTGFLQASAKDFLLLLVTYEDTLFQARDLRLSNLASHKALLRLLASKFAVSPRGLDSKEREYLVSSSYQLFPIKRVQPRTRIQNAISFGLIMETSDGNDLTYKAGKNFFSFVTANEAGSLTDAIGVAQDFDAALEAACKESSEIVHARNKQLPQWNKDDILIGSRAILAAPLSMSYIQQAIKLL